MPIRGRAPTITNGGPQLGFAGTPDPYRPHHHVQFTVFHRKPDNTESGSTMKVSNEVIDAQQPLSPAMAVRGVPWRSFRSVFAAAALMAVVVVSLPADA